MNKHPLGGIFTALLTPFDKNGKVNEKALCDLIEFNVGKGVDGFYVNGSTAESFLLTEAERKLVYELVADRAKGRVKLIAQVGAIATDQAIGWAKLAESLGYDAVSSVAPFYFKFSADEVKKYYFDIVNEVSLPMIVYHIPAFSGVAMGAAAFGAFLTDDRFAGVKYTATDYFLMEQIKTAYPDKVIYNGYDETFLCGLSMGADGGIGSTYNVMPEMYLRVYNAFRAGDLATATATQRKIASIVTELIRHPVIPSVKVVLEEMGYAVGQATFPMKRLTETEKADLIAAVTAAGVSLEKFA